LYMIKLLRFRFWRIYL